MLNYFGGNVLLGAVLLTGCILIFSEITPKTMAAVKPESFARRSSLLLKALLYVLRPLIAITNYISSKVLKIFNINVKDAKDNDNLNTQELKTLLDESGDLIPKQYRGMLSSILGMEELVVEDIMTPTSEVIGIDVDLGYKNNKTIIESSEYTRLPVFKNSIDNELGTLHLKDSHDFLDKIESNKDVQSELSKTYFVSQSTALMKQLKEFQDNDRNMALVVDEYGEIQGLITIEDIFKEIAGKFGSDRIELEKEFIRDCLPVNSVGLSSEEFCSYIDYIADRRLNGVGLDVLHPGLENPFPWLAETIDVKKEQNFFEGRVTEYQKSSALPEVSDDDL